MDKFELLTFQVQGSLPINGYDLLANLVTSLLQYHHNKKYEYNLDTEQVIFIQRVNFQSQNLELGPSLVRGSMQSYRYLNTNSILTPSFLTKNSLTGGYVKMAKTLFF